MINDINLDLEKRTGKYHLIACWVAIVLNPIFLINDKNVLEETEFIQITVSKILLSVFLLACIYLREKLNISYKTMGILPVCLICVSSSYMYAEAIDIKAFHIHSFSYTTLFLGAGMLCLWELKISIIIFIFNLFFIFLWQYLYGEFSITEFFINGGALTISSSAFMILLIEIRYKLILNNIRSEFNLKEAKEIIEHKNEEITSSIQYAEKIQKVIIPPLDLFKNNFDDAFIFYQSKDIVSGDFYWINQHENKVCIAVTDCTGHGVPGAFITFMGHDILNLAVEHYKNSLNSSNILKYLHKGIQKRLNPYSSNNKINDSMDISICVIDLKSYQLSFSGAHNGLLHIRNNKMNFLKGSGIILGDLLTEESLFTSHIIDLSKGDQIYLYTDGFQDQFGGPKGRKFMSKRFREMIHRLSEKPIKEQYKDIKNTFNSWKGDEEQIDDITVLGIKV